MQAKQKDSDIWAYLTASLKGTLSRSPPHPQSALRKKNYGLWGWLSQCSICPCTSLRFRFTSTHIEDVHGDVCI